MKYTLLLPFSLLLSTLSFANEKQHVDLLIHHANVVDIKNAVVIPNQTIAITDAKIIARGDDALKLNYHATTQIDAQGRFVMPGLWDMHVHFGGGDALIEENKQLLPLYLAYGVTTVRDAAADLSPSVLSWREQITKGELIGPTIYTSGPKLEGKDSIWPGDLEVETTQEMHAAIDKLDAMNVDFVKITDSALTPELYLQAVKEVKKRGYKISGHIPFSLSVTDVSSAGLDAIEHMTYLLKAAAKNEDDISAKVKAGELSYRSALPVVMDNIDKDTAMKKYRLLAKNNTAIVPTLIGGQVTAYIDEDNHQQDKFLNYLGKGLKDTYQWRVDRANKDTPAQIKARKQRFVQTAQLLPWAQEAGVPIIAGTDAGFLNSYIYPGLSLHQELAIFSDYGLTPQQILHSATQAGPTFLDKAQQFGSLEVGKVADIIILDSNPLINVRNTQSLQGVISHNRYYDKAALENLKAQAKQFVSSQQ